MIIVLSILLQGESLKVCIIYLTSIVYVTKATFEDKHFLALLKKKNLKKGFKTVLRSLLATTVAFGFNSYLSTTSDKYKQNINQT